MNEGIHIVYENFVILRYAIKDWCVMINYVSFTWIINNEDSTLYGNKHDLMVINLKIGLYCGYK